MVLAIESRATAYGVKTNIIRPTTFYCFAAFKRYSLRFIAETVKYPPRRDRQRVDIEFGSERLLRPAYRRVRVSISNRVLRARGRRTTISDNIRWKNTGDKPDQININRSPTNTGSVPPVSLTFQPLKLWSQRTVFGI
jgi:hypothetical protein